MELIVEDFEFVAPVELNPNRPPMTDEEFLTFCQHYPDCMVEVTGEGKIIIMPPAHPRTGERNGSIFAQLYIWAKADGRGRVFDSSSVFVLPNGARRAPDAFLDPQGSYRGSAQRTAGRLLPPLPGFCHRTSLRQ